MTPQEAIQREEDYSRSGEEYFTVGPFNRACGRASFGLLRGDQEGCKSGPLAKAVMATPKMVVQLTSLKLIFSLQDLVEANLIFMERSDISAITLRTSGVGT